MASPMMHSRRDDLYGTVPRWIAFMVVIASAAIAADRTRSFAATTVPTSAPAIAVEGANWPTFRGENSGVVVAPSVATDWDGPTGRNVRWRTPVPLPGNNSPVIWGGHLFCSGAGEDRQEVYCFDADTGRLRWRTAVGAPDPAKAPKVMRETGYAPSTLATDGLRVYAIFATGDLAALDFDGRVVWSKPLGPLENQYGHASSLAMWQDRLIVQLDQGLSAKENKSALLAFDGATGVEVWRTPRPVFNSWTSPLVITVTDGPQVVTVADPWVIAYEPRAGTELWRAKCVHGDVAPSAAHAAGTVFVAQENAEAHAIRTDGRGDVTETHVAWHVDDALPDIVSPLATTKYVFLTTSLGTVTCLDTATGKKVWSHDFDGPLCATPILINDVVHLTDTKGVTMRFEAAPTFKLLNAPALGEPVHATPAVAQGRIYFRGDSNLYCVAPPP